MTAHEMGGATRISTNASLYDAFIARYDSSGNPIAVGGDNATLFGTSRTDWPRDIAFDSSGNYYITGTTEGAFAGKTNSAQMEDVFIRKYNSNHTVAWTVQYDDSDSSRTNRDYGNGIAVDSSNNVFIVGTHSSGLFSNSTTGSGIFVSKHNGSNGSQIWFKSLDGSGQTDVGLQIGLDSSGNVYVSGYSDSTDDWGGEPAQHSSSYKPWIAKLNNSNGNQIWLRKMSISRSGSLQAVLDNGTIYLAGGNSDDSIFFADGEYKNHLIMMDGTSTLSQSSFDGRDNVSFVLNSQPTSTVTVNLTSADTGEFTLSTSTLSFSTSNWNTPQQVLVYAVQDNDTSDGNQNVNLNYSSTSSDSNYNSLSGSLSVTVVNAAAPVPSEPYLLTATGGSGQVALTWEPPLTEPAVTPSTTVQTIQASLPSAPMSPMKTIRTQV